AVVEGSLQRAGVTCGRTISEQPPTTPAASTPDARPRGVLVLQLSPCPFSLSFPLGLGTLGLYFRLLELGRDQRVVLRAQVDLVGVVLGDWIERVLVADGLVLALELSDVAHAGVELMSDPWVGAALPYPRADLIEVGAQGSTGHERSRTLAHP